MKRSRALDVFSNVCLVIGWFGWTGAHAYGADTALGRGAWIALMIAMPGVLFLLHRYWDKPDPGPIANWYRISFDASQIKIELTPPASPSIRTIPWSTIASAKFASNGIMSSDEVWLYAKDRGKVFVKIPTEASGEPEFVGELASRKLLDVRELIGTNG